MNNKELVLACDFETHTKIADNLVAESFVVAFACKEVFRQQKTHKIEVQKIEEINNKVFYFDSLSLDLTTINNFFNYLFSFKDYQKVNIFFHNLKNFDGFFMVPYLLDNFQQVTTEMEVQNGDFRLLYVNNFLLNIKVKNDNVEYNFIDSLAFFPGSSLKQLGEIIGLPKLDFDSHFDILEEKPKNSERYLKFTEYTKRDVEILAKFILFFVNKTKINLLNSFSAAGISFNYFKEKYYQPGLFLSSQEQWAIIQKSYYGGFTFLNKKFELQVLDNLNYFDINSAYPFVLRLSLPYGDMEVYNGQTGGAKIYQIEITELEVNELKIPILRSKKYNERFIKNYKGKLIYYIWDFELAFVKHFYKTFKHRVIQVYWFRLKKVADKFIDHFYSIKKETSTKLVDFKKYTKQGLSENKNAQFLANNLDNVFFNNNNLAEQKLMNFFAKVVLNSLYGKFGEKLIKPQRFYIKKELLKNNPSELLLHNKLYHINTIHSKKNYKNFIEVTILPENPKVGKIKNNAIASFVTAKVRTMLYNQILKHKNTFVYCDTDSIILQNDSISDFYLSEEELGLWKIEHKNVKGYFIKPKQYFLDSKNKLLFKTAGFQKLLTEASLESAASSPLIFEKLSSKKTAYGVTLTPQKSKLEGGKWQKIEETPDK